MKVHFVIVGVFAIAFAWAATAGAAQDSKSATAVQGQNADPNAADKTALDSVAVTINGVDIMESQVEQMIQSFINIEDSEIPPELVGQVKKQIRAQVLDDLIAEHLLGQKIKEKNVKITEADIDREIAEILRLEGLSMEDFQTLLQAYGTNLQEYKKRGEIRRRFLYKKFFELELAGKINIGDQQAKKYYEDNIERFKVPEQVRLSHISIDTSGIDPNSDADQAKAKLRSQAQQLLDQIRAGADFDELAKAAVPGRQGGDLGFRDREAPLPEEFKQAAFALNAGEVSDIVQTQYGFHIIKATDRMAAFVKEFKQVRHEILEELTYQKKQKLAMEYIESLKAAAEIIYPQGKGQEPTNAGTEDKAASADSTQQSKPQETPAELQGKQATEK